MTGNEILPVLGFTIAIFSAFQGLFRWLAVPRVELRPRYSFPPEWNHINFYVGELYYSLHYIEV